MIQPEDLWVLIPSSINTSTSNNQTNKSTNRINHSINQASNQSINQPTNKPINHLLKSASEIICGTQLLIFSVETSVDICWDQLVRLSVELDCWSDLLRLSVERLMLSSSVVQLSRFTKCPFYVFYRYEIHIHDSGDFI